MKRKILLYLVSDSTGETVLAVSRSATAQFKDLEVEEHLWPFVQSEGNLKKLKAAIMKNAGIVMYTFVDKELSNSLQAMCNKLKILCIPILSRVISDLSIYLDMEASGAIGKQHELTEEYFSRVDAVNYSLAHDDGKSSWDLDEADIVLIGPSRTSKSPTCLYLAYKGYRTANIPFVLGCDLPKNLFEIKNVLILGLTISPEILIEVRKHRMLSLHSSDDIGYVNSEEVEEEIKQAKKICRDNDWPLIDVSRRSVEETAALILQYYEKKIREKV